MKHFQTTARSSKNQQDQADLPSLIGYPSGLKIAPISILAAGISEYFLSLFVNSWLKLAYNKRKQLTCNPHPLWLSIYF